MSSNNIEFDLALANKIKDKFNIPDTTIRVWKYRNKIPSKYLSEEYVKEKKVARNATTNKLLEILKRKEISAYNFRTFKTPQRGADIVNKELLFTENEVLGIKTEVVEIRNKLRLMTRHTTKKNIEEIMKDKRIVHSVLFGKNAYYNLLQNKDFGIHTDPVKVKVSAFYNLIRL